MARGLHFIPLEGKTNMIFTIINTVLIGIAVVSAIASAFSVLPERDR